MTITRTIPQYEECANIPDEVWKQVPLKGFDRIMVSNLGRLKRWTIRTYRNPWKGYVLCKPWEYNNYLALKVRTETYNSRHYFVHRLVAITFIPIPEDLKPHKAFVFLDGVEFIVNHKDGDKYNNTVENLEWCDNAFNVAHAYDNNLYTNNVNVEIEDTLTGLSTQFNALGKASKVLKIRERDLVAVVKIFEGKLFKGRYRITILDNGRLHAKVSAAHNGVLYKDYRTNTLVIAKSLSHASYLSATRVTDISLAVSRFIDNGEDKLINGYAFRYLNSRICPWMHFTDEEVTQSKLAYEDFIENKFTT